MNIPRIYLKRLTFLSEDLFRFVKRVLQKIINRLYYRSELSDDEIKYPQRPPSGKY